MYTYIYIHTHVYIYMLIYMQAEACYKLADLCLENADHYLCRSAAIDQGVLCGVVQCGAVRCSALQCIAECVAVCR